MFDINNCFLVFKPRLSLYKIIAYCLKFKCMPWNLPEGIGYVALEPLSKKDYEIANDIIEKRELF